MPDILLYANLALVIAVLILEVWQLFKKPDFRFARLVGIVGLCLLVAAYGAIAVNPKAGMVGVMRPGFSLLFGYIAARDIYELYRR